jgi:hypothetical protein
VHPSKNQQAKEHQQTAKCIHRPGDLPGNFMFFAGDLAGIRIQAALRF